MKYVLRVSVVVAALLVELTSAQSRVPSQIFCWTPDVEFPVACDDEAEDDEPGLALKHQGS